MVNSAVASRKRERITQLAIPRHLRGASRDAILSGQSFNRNPSQQIGTLAAVADEDKLP
jgi:hypothetical protein